jgi:hypothetical protein
MLSVGIDVCLVRARDTEIKPRPYQSQGQKQDTNERAQRVNGPAEISAPQSKELQSLRTT